MTSPIQPSPRDGGIGRGVLAVALVLVVVVIVAIWYSRSIPADDPGVTVSVPTGDPGTETTISP